MKTRLITFTAAVAVTAAILCGAGSEAAKAAVYLAR
jgi:hypothetical protein